MTPFKAVVVAALFNVWVGIQGFSEGTEPAGLLEHSGRSLANSKKHGHQLPETNHHKSGKKTASHFKGQTQETALAIIPDSSSTDATLRKAHPHAKRGADATALVALDKSEEEDIPLTTANGEVNPMYLARELARRHDARQKASLAALHQSHDAHKGSDPDASATGEKRLHSMIREPHLEVLKALEKAQREHQAVHQELTELASKERGRR